MYRSYGYHLSLTCVYNKHNHSNHASLTALPTSNSMPTLTEQTSILKNFLSNYSNHVVRSHAEIAARSSQSATALLLRTPTATTYPEHSAFDFIYLGSLFWCYDNPQLLLLWIQAKLSCTQRRPSLCAVAFNIQLLRMYTQGDSDVMSFHIYASWFSPPPCG